MFSANSCRNSEEFLIPINQSEIVRALAKVSCRVSVLMREHVLLLRNLPMENLCWFRRGERITALTCFQPNKRKRFSIGFQWLYVWSCFAFDEMFEQNLCDRISNLARAFFPALFIGCQLVQRPDHSAQRIHFHNQSESSCNLARMIFPALFTGCQFLG